MNSSKKVSLIIVLSLFLISFAFRLYDLKAVGETWDEVTVVRNGAIYLKYLSDFDFSRESWSLNREHPPLAKYVYGTTQVLTKISPRIAAIDSEYPEGKHFILARVISVLFGSVAVVFVYLLAQSLYDKKVAIIAALIFSFLPHVLAHTKIAALESPLLVFTLASTYFFVKERYALSGLFLGFSIATKFNAFFFVLLFFALSIIKTNGNQRRKNIRGFIAVIFISAIFLLITWPWLWSNPVTNLFESLNLSNDVAGKEYFLGKDSYLPVSYYFIYFIATTPLLILGLFSIFLVKLYLERQRDDFVIFLYFLTPFIGSFFSLKQDGIRYIFPFYPALAILSSVGLFFIIKQVKGIVGETNENMIMIISGLILFVQLMFSNFSVHPYYLDYYNAFVGGPKSVYERKLFEIGWWGEGVREAVLYVNDVAPPNSSVNTSFTPAHVAPKFRDDIVMVHGRVGEDYVITNTYQEWYDVDVDPKEYEQIYAVTVSGAPIAKVYQKR